jgi:hypothetical protein
VEALAADLAGEAAAGDLALGAAGSGLLDELVLDEPLLPLKRPPRLSFGIRTSRLKVGRSSPSGKASAATAATEMGTMKFRRRTMIRRAGVMFIKEGLGN